MRPTGSPTPPSAPPALAPVVPGVVDGPFPEADRDNPRYVPLGFDAQVIANAGNHVLDTATDVILTSVVNRITRMHRMLAGCILREGRGPDNIDQVLKIIAIQRDCLVTLQHILLARQNPEPYPGNIFSPRQGIPHAVLIPMRDQK